MAGFDDIEETRAVIPSLTTVRTPWHLLGSKSVDLILSKLAGEALPEQIHLQTELVCRQSCGCGAAALKEHPAAAAAVHETAPGEYQELVGDFLADVRSGEGSSSRFLQTLEESLSGLPSGTEIIEWQGTLDAIRAKVDSRLQPEPEAALRAHALLEDGYALIGELAHRRQLSQRLKAEDQTDRLNRIVQTMATTYEIDALMKLLADELPGLGIQSCFLSLYDEKGEPPAWSRLILACDGKERLPLGQGGTRFSTRELVPAGMLPENRRYAYNVEALYFQKDQIGFVLFEIGPRDGDVYTTLRGHISSALKSAELVQVALEAEAKAVKADQLKTRLLANVSHELRAPINIILGLSQLALSAPNPYGIELPDRLRQDLEYIFDSGEHLVRLINDLLDMSRAEIGELDLNFEAVSPRSLLVETFETMRDTSSHKHKKIALILDVPDHLPILHADPVRLRQIFINLLSNAIKFTERGQVTLGADIQLPHLHLWVADTGPGISPELQERIFEPFVKADPPGQPKGGIGLGLSITRRLVALHGGSISLESQPGKGSTFHVYLPLPGISAQAAKKVEPENDQPVLCWLSSQKTPPPAVLALSKRSGLEPCRLATTDDLTRVLQQSRPAAIAWDLDNARPGDWSIIQKLRTYSQYCQLPLLLFQESVKEDRSGTSRVTNVLLKPVGKQALRHVLDLLPQAAQPGEIWIIDDDPVAIQYYQELIGESLSEFRVQPVSGGKEAINLLAEGSPDLVLLDLMMPEVDGFQVLEHLRAHPKTASIPVIVLTGKMLTYEDVRRLDVPKVLLQTKGVLTAQESVSELQRILAATSQLPQPTSQLVKQAFAYIQQNYPRAFSLTELAETIGVSKSYLSRIFKLDTGISLWDYLNRYRIQKAKELLLLTDKSITEISAQVGYEDVGYFSRIFRGVSGCTPRAYRHARESTRTETSRQ